MKIKFIKEEYNDFDFLIEIKLIKENQIFIIEEI